MSEQSAIEVALSGVCVVCGCTEESPCIEDGELCAWTDESRTMCDFCAEAAYDAHAHDADEEALALVNEGYWDDSYGDEDSFDDEDDWGDEE